MNIKSILDGIKCFIENPKSYELLYSKNDEIHNEYALSEREGKLLLEYITKLQNNWNELKKFIEEKIDYLTKIDGQNIPLKDSFEFCSMNELYQTGKYSGFKESLEKMQELESE